MPEVASTAHSDVVRGIEAVFDFHACILVYVDVITHASGLFHVELCAHVHVECLVSLCLAVLNACNFTFVLRSSKIKFDAVLVALFEKNLWKCMLLQGSLIVHRVLTPVGCHCNKEYILNKIN